MTVTQVNQGINLLAVELQDYLKSCYLICQLNCES